MNEETPAMDGLRGKVPSALDAYIEGKMCNPEDLSRLREMGLSGLADELEDRYPRLLKVLLEEAHPEEKLSKEDLRLLVAHPASAEENPIAARKNGMYPTIRDLAAQVWLRLKGSGTRENAGFVLKCFGTSDHVNHPALQRWMLAVGIPVEAAGIAAE